MPVMEQPSNSSYSRQFVEKGNLETGSLRSAQTNSYSSINNSYGHQPDYRRAVNKSVQRDLQLNGQPSTFGRQDSSTSEKILAGGKQRSPKQRAARNDEWANEYEKWGRVGDIRDYEEDALLVDQSQLSFTLLQQDQKQDSKQSRSMIPRAPIRNIRFSRSEKENMDNSNIPKPQMLAKPTTSSDSTSRALSSSSSSRSQSGNSYTTSIQRWQLRTQNVLFSGISGRNQTGSVRSMDSPVPTFSQDTNSVTSEAVLFNLNSQHQQQQSEGSSEGSSKYIPLERQISSGSVSSVSIEDYITGDANARIRAGSRTPSEASFEFTLVHQGEDEEKSETEKEKENEVGQKMTSVSIKEQQQGEKIRILRSIGAVFCVIMVIMAVLLPRLWVSDYVPCQVTAPLNLSFPSHTPSSFVHGFSTQPLLSTYKSSIVIQDSPTKNKFSRIINTENNNEPTPLNPIGHMHEMQLQISHEVQYSSDQDKLQKNEDLVQLSSLIQQQQQQQLSIVLVASSEDVQEMYEMQQKQTREEREVGQHFASDEEAAVKPQLQDDPSVITNGYQQDSMSNNGINTESSNEAAQEQIEDHNRHTPTHRQSWSSPFASAKDTRQTHTLKEVIRSIKEQITNSIIGPWILSLSLSLVIVMGAGQCFGDLLDWIFDKLNTYNDFVNRYAQSKVIEQDKLSQNQLSSHQQSYSLLCYRQISTTWLSAHEHGDAFSEETRDTASTPRRRSRRLLQNHRP